MSFRRKLHLRCIGAACLLPLAFTLTFAFAGSMSPHTGTLDPEAGALSASPTAYEANGAAAFQGGNRPENTEPAIQTSRERLLVLFCATLLEVGKEAGFSLTPAQAEQLAGILQRSVGRGEMTKEESEEAKHLLTGKQRDMFEKVFADDAKRSLQGRALETGGSREHCGDTAPNFYGSIPNGGTDAVEESSALRPAECGPLKEEPELNLEQQTLHMLNRQKSAAITGRNK
ncbi:hypothetical protein ACFC0X_06215 [Paenibacillus chitinolyticus]|uniref:hypothetical protein n=1 Tax=Paenibacillus chitinolyticus TaxID=79263 RepID=UPI0035DA45F6